MFVSNPRITYKSQQSGEYYIYLDGQFFCSSDSYTELKEDIMALEAELDSQEDGNQNEPDEA